MSSDEESSVVAVSLFLPPESLSPLSPSPELASSCFPEPLSPDAVSPLPEDSPVS